MSDLDLLNRFAGVVNMNNWLFIRPAGEPADWPGRVEERTGLFFPELYFLFATNFQFSEFDAGGEITFFASDPVSDHAEAHIEEKIFADPQLSRVCLKKGFLQFGTALDRIYDPICFDTRFSKTREDCPIVQLDHEEVLLHGRTVVIKRIAPTFRSFIESIVDAV